MSFQPGDKYCPVLDLGALPILNREMGWDKPPFKIRYPDRERVDEEFLALWEDPEEGEAWELLGNGEMFNEDGSYNPYWDMRQDADNLKEAMAYRGWKLRKKHVEMGKREELCSSARYAGSLWSCQRCSAWRSMRLAPPTYAHPAWRMRILTFLIWTMIF